MVAPWFQHVCKKYDNSLRFDCLFLYLVTTILHLPSTGHNKNWAQMISFVSPSTFMKNYYLDQNSFMWCQQFVLKLFKIGVLCCYKLLKCLSLVLHVILSMPLFLMKSTHINICLWWTVCHAITSIGEKNIMQTMLISLMFIVVGQWCNSATHTKWILYYNEFVDETSVEGWGSHMHFKLKGTTKLPTNDLRITKLTHDVMWAMPKIMGYLVLNWPHIWES